MPPHRVCAFFVALPALVAAASCASAAIDGGFDSPNPAAKLYAIEAAAKLDDRSPATLRRIVEQLDSDDPAVRLVAIGALSKLTGETHGYEHGAPRAARLEAIGRWSTFLASVAEGGQP